MAEQHQRCRFWPRCSIHQGLPPSWVPGMAVFTDAEVQEMRQEREAGWTWREIGALWGTSANYVSLLVRKSKRGLPV